MLKNRQDSGVVIGRCQPAAMARQRRWSSLPQLFKMAAPFQCLLWRVYRNGSITAYRQPVFRTAHAK